MASFKANVSGVAPLRIQLTAPSSRSIRIMGFTAVGENGNGNAGRPVLSRPVTPGTGTGASVAMDGTGVAAASTVVTSFSITPTDPTSTTGAFNLPIAVHVRFGQDDAPIVPPGQTILLYAGANSGHTWMGELEWEEGDV